MSNIEIPTSPHPDSGANAEAQSPLRLWNPNAAGCWSLIFSPLFGAYLHMKNWQALGDSERAKQSKSWVIGSLIFFVVVVLSSVFLPDTKSVDAVLRLAGFALVISWYYSIGKSQQVYVAARFGKNYVHRGWAKPLLAALLAMLVFFVLIFAVVLVIQTINGAA